MAILTVEKNGSWNCRTCGGSDFVDKVNVIRCFNCEDCNSYKKEGLKIVDKRGEQPLSRWAV
jgi:hypothetical protein